MPQQKEKPKRKSADTRAHIIATATPMFAQTGYGATALSEIVQRAAVTTGAVYYHFGDKKGLFCAVAESVEESILAEMSRLLPAQELTWETFEQTVGSALEVCARPEIQQIVFVDAPTVIGLREWREIEMKYAFGVFKQMLVSLAGAGEIVVEDTDLSAQILLGAIIEAAHATSDASNKKKALQNAKQMIIQMLRSLRP